MPKIRIVFIDPGGEIVDKVIVEPESKWERWLARHVDSDELRVYSEEVR